MLLLSIFSIVLTIGIVAIVIAVRSIGGGNRRKVIAPYAEEIDRHREFGRYDLALEAMERLIEELPDDYDISVKKEMLVAESEGTPWQVPPGKSTVGRKLFDI